MQANREQQMSGGGFPRSVVVHGTGLMGSSLALALKKYLPGIRVYGIDSAEVLDRARRLGAVDPETAPAIVDLTILATLVGTGQRKNRSPVNRSEDAASGPARSDPVIG